MVFIGDQAWFYLSARDALLSGQLPLLGITSSIVWLHQGALWTYLLSPALLLSNFNPVSGLFLSSIFNILTLILMYLTTGLSGVFLLLAMPLFWLNTLMPYHTSPIPLFMLIAFLLLKKRRDLLFGLFLGLLYQLHLLTFIFWPLILFRPKAILGFVVGITPFLLVGLVQTFGIFVWLAKQVLTGGSGIGSISDAYKIVLMIPTVLLLTRLPKIIKVTILVVLFLRFSLQLPVTKISQVDFPLYPSDTAPYEYMTWWESRVMTQPQP